MPHDQLVRSVRVSAVARSASRHWRVLHQERRLPERRRASRCARRGLSVLRQRLQAMRKQHRLPGRDPCLRHAQWTVRSLCSMSRVRARRGLPACKPALRQSCLREVRDGRRLRRRCVHERRVRPGLLRAEPVHCSFHRVQRCAALRRHTLLRFFDVSRERHVHERVLCAQDLQHGRGVQRLLRESAVLRQPRLLPRSALLPIAPGVVAGSQSPDITH